MKHDHAQQGAEKPNEGQEMTAGALASRDHDPVTSISQLIASDGLENKSHHSTTKISRNDMLQLVAKYYDISVAELKMRSRKAQFVVPRQMFMLLAKEAEFTTNQIGRTLGGRDHSTVVHGAQAMEKRIAEDDTLRKDYQTLSTAMTLMNSGAELADIIKAIAPKNEKSVKSATEPDMPAPPIPPAPPVEVTPPPERALPKPNAIPPILKASEEELENQQLYPNSELKAAFSNLLLGHLHATRDASQINLCKKTAYHEAAQQLAMLIPNAWQNPPRELPYDVELVRSWLLGANVPEPAAWEGIKSFFTAHADHLSGTDLFAMQRLYDEMLGRQLIQECDNYGEVRRTLKSRLRAYNLKHDNRLQELLPVDAAYRPSETKLLGRQMDKGELPKINLSHIYGSTYMTLVFANAFDVLLASQGCHDTPLLKDVYWQQKQSDMEANYPASQRYGLGAMLEALIDYAELSPLQLAETIDVSQPTVLAWISGERPREDALKPCPSAEELERFIDVIATREKTLMEFYQLKGESFLTEKRIATLKAKQKLLWNDRDASKNDVPPAQQSAVRAHENIPNTQLTGAPEAHEKGIGAPEIIKQR